MYVSGMRKRCKRAKKEVETVVNLPAKAKKRYLTFVFAFFIFPFRFTHLLHSIALMPIIFQIALTPPPLRHLRSS